MSLFEINQVVIYNPNVENLLPINKRIHDIGIIRKLTNSHALVFFPYMGFLTICFGSLIKAPSNIKLPKALKSKKLYNLVELDENKSFLVNFDFEYNQEPIDVQPN